MGFTVALPYCVQCILTMQVPHCPLLLPLPLLRLHFLFTASFSSTSTSYILLLWTNDLNLGYSQGGVVYWSMGISPLPTILKKISPLLQQTLTTRRPQAGLIHASPLQDVMFQICAGSVQVTTGAVSWRVQWPWHSLSSRFYMPSTPTPSVPWAFGGGCVA